MHKCDSSSLVLLKILVASTALVTACTFLGPYDYQFESTKGAVYYYLCILLLGVPLCFCGEKNQRLVKNKGLHLRRAELSAGGEKLVLFASVLSLLAALGFAVECIRLFSIEAILAGGDFRLEFGESRSSLSQYAEMIACLGPASYLVTSGLERTRSKLLIPVSLTSLVCMGLTGLLLGARWKIFLCLLIFVFSKRYSRNDRIAFPGQVKTIFRRLLMFLAIALVIYTFFVLFTVRGQLSADEQYRFYYGDMPLKPWASFLFDLTNGAVQPVYRAIDYIGQSPFVFSYLFEHYIPDRLYFGAFALRILGYLLPMIGIPFPKSSDIAGETFTGMYSGSAYGFITDFGVVLAPVIFFVVGLSFAAIERRRVFSRFSSMAFPLICGMVACSPVYYLFHVGYADYVLWWLLALYGMLSAIGAWAPGANAVGFANGARKGSRERMQAREIG